MISKLFKANAAPSSKITRQRDLFYAVSALNHLRWQLATETMLPESYLHWLQHTGSLTAWLEQSAQQLSLELLTEGWQSAADNVSDVRIRQVLLCDGLRPWIWGLTEVTDEQLQQESELLNWLDKPLGHLLFAEAPRIARSFELADFSENTEFCQILSKWGCPARKPLWGRRCALQYRSCQLRLTEVFLPDHPMYGV